MNQLVLALLLALAPLAQNEPAQQQLVIDYVQAFNAPADEQIRAFFNKYITTEGLERVPMDVRLARFTQMKERLGKLELVKILKVSPESITTHLRSGQGGLIELTFELEAADPPKLRALRVEDLEEGETQPAGSPKASDQELVEAVDQYLGEASSADRFSGAVLIASGDRVVFEKAYGLADKESRVPNRTDTRFNLGSINKIFTNIAIHQLVSEGRLSLDDTISKILPDYPNQEAAAKVTVKHLLKMTSGVGDFFNERFEATPKDTIVSIKDYLGLFADKPLEFEPGSRSRYSNGGYIVLGAIIEKVSGTDYYSYVRKNIYEPAGMKDSDWFERSKLPGNTAIGYTQDGAAETKPNARRVRNHQTLPGKGSSAGGGYSTLRDLLAFVRALKEGKLSTPDFRADGLGIAGGAPGINAILDTDLKYTVVVLSNYDPPTAETVGRQIRAWLPR